MALDERISSMRGDFLTHALRNSVDESRKGELKEMKKKLVIPKTFSRTKTDARYFEVSLTWLIEEKELK